MWRFSTATTLHCGTELCLVDSLYWLVQTFVVATAARCWFISQHWFTWRTNSTHYGGSFILLPGPLNRRRQDVRRRQWPAHAIGAHSGSPLQRTPPTTWFCAADLIHSPLSAYLALVGLLNCDIPWRDAAAACRRYNARCRVPSSVPARAMHNACVSSLIAVALHTPRQTTPNNNERCGGQPDGDGGARLYLPSLYSLHLTNNTNHCAALAFGVQRSLYTRRAAYLIIST